MMLTVVHMRNSVLCNHWTGVDASHAWGDNFAVAGESVNNNLAGIYGSHPTLGKSSAYNDGYPTAGSKALSFFICRT